MEAKALDIKTRPVVLGPLSFLLLGKVTKDAPEGFKPLDLLEKLLPVYEQLLARLEKEGAEWVQLDEPVLVLDQPAALKDAYKKAYETLTKAAPGLKLLVSTYFGRLGDNLDILVNLPVAAVHLDLVRAPEELERVLAKLPATVSLSLGVINGRNIWKGDLSKAVATVKQAVEKLGKDRVLVAPSCSLLHTPHSLEAEKKMNPEIKVSFYCNRAPA